MIWAVLVIVIFLIFPIYLTFKTVILIEDKKVFFNVKLFNIIKIFSGYLTFDKTEFSIHLSSVKSIVIPYLNIISFRNKIKIYKDYHVKRILFVSQYGNKDLLNSSIYNFVTKIILKLFDVFLLNKKPYIFKFLESKIDLEQEKSIFFIKINIVFNFLLILLSLFKTIMERIKNVVNRKKQNKYGISNSI